MKSEILNMLRATGGYLSGQQLCDKMGVSRTAVWKAVNDLKEEGYIIEAVRNRGYRLVEDADVITQAELKSILKPDGLGTGWNILMKRIPRIQGPGSWQRKGHPTAPW